MGSEAGERNGKGSLFRKALAALLIIAASGLFPALPLEPRGQEAGKPIQHEVEVTLRLIQVYVSDRSGNAIRDLVKEDFIVTDDGTPVVITDFEEHAAVLAADAGGAEPATSAVATAASPMARKYFIFFDFGFNSPYGAMASLKAAGHFFDTIARPGDEVAVLSYSAAKGLKVHEFLTPELAKARQAVAGISAKEIAGRAEEIEREYWDLRAFVPPDSKDAFLRGEILRTEAGRRQSQYQARDYLTTLTALAKALRLVPGSKSFLFFSTGIPTTLVQGNPAISQGTGMGRGNLSEPSRFSYDMGDRTLQPLWENMLREFSASDCPFFVFDTRGAAKQMSLFGTDALLGKGTASTSTYSAALLGYDANNPFADDKVTGIDALRALSKRTGGRYFSNIGSYDKNLADVEGLTGTFYVLGYYPARAKTGKFHRIKVDVKRKGARVMAPSGFYDPKPFAEYTKLEKDLHLFDLALNERAMSRLPLTVPVTALAAPAAEGSGLRVLARISGDVTARFDGERVEYVAIIFNDQGDIRAIRRGEAEGRRGRGQAAVFTAAISLGPGDYACRVVVRDMETGLSAVGSTKATLRAPAAPGLRLWTPLLLEEQTGCVWVEAAPGKAGKGLPWDDVYAFDRSRYVPAAGRISRLRGELTAVLPYSVAGPAEPDLAISAHFIEASSGQAIVVQPVASSRSEHPVADSVTLALPLDGLAPGTYHLYISAEDRVSGTKAGTRTTVTIE